MIAKIPGSNQWLWSTVATAAAVAIAILGRTEAIDS